MQQRDKDKSTPCLICQGAIPLGWVELVYAANCKLNSRICRLRLLDNILIGRLVRTRSQGFRAKLEQTLVTSASWRTGAAMRTAHRVTSKFPREILNVQATSTYISREPQPA